VTEVTPSHGPPLRSTPNGGIHTAAGGGRYANGPEDQIAVECYLFLFYIQAVSNCSFHGQRNAMRRRQRVAAGVVVVLALMAGGCGRGNLEQEASALSEKAVHLTSEGKYGEALPLIGSALEIYGDGKHDSAAGDNAILAAICYRKLGLYDSALLSYQRAIEYFHTLKHQKLERRGWIALAEFYNLLREPQSAFTLASDAAGSAKVFDDRPDAYAALRIAATASHLLGNYDRELSLLQEVRRLDSLLYGSRSRGELLLAGFRATEASGDYAKTRAMWERWRRGVSGDSVLLAQAYHALGRAQLAAGYPDSALRSFSQGLGFIGRSGPLRMGLLAALGNLGYGSRRFDNARFYYTDALALAQQSRSLVDESMLRLMIIACDAKSKGVSSADLVKRCNAVLSTCRDAGFLFGEAVSLFLRARITEPVSDATAALGNYREALAAYERLVDVPEEGGEIGAFASTLMRTENTDWYQPLIASACSRRSADEAFALTERKNRGELSRFFASLSMTNADDQLRRAVERFQMRYHGLRLLQEDLREELRGGSGEGSGGERLSAMRALLPARVQGLAAAAKDVEQHNGNFARLLLPQPLTLREVRDSLPADAVLLEFLPISEGVAVLAARKDTAVLKLVPIGGSHLADLVRDYCRFISDPRLDDGGAQFNAGGALGRVHELSAVLGNTLLEPVLPMIRSGATVYVVPPASFGWLPVHTLKLGGVPLATRATVSYLPTAAALFFPKKREGYVSEVIGIGHPGKTSWDVEYELKDIRGFYEKARMLFSSDATVAFLDTAVYQLLHFTAEFHLNTKQPDKAAAVLSDGKTVYGLHDVSLGEMMKFPAPQTLVFSNITPKPGELARYAPLAFLANGTSTVVVTMWPGERRGKKDFGEIFYTSVQTGLGAGQAYQNAIVAMAKGSRSAALNRWGLYYRFGR